MSTATTPRRRRTHRTLAAVLTAASLTTIGALPASAAPANGCPASRAGWELLTVEAVAARLAGVSSGPVFRELVDWLDTTYNRNGDNMLCLTSRWGTHLNEHSRWYKQGMDEIGQPYDLFLMMDNTANARG